MNANTERNPSDIIKVLLGNLDHGMKDFSKAYTALRSYGASHDDTVCILSTEVLLLKDYELMCADSISPKLVEVFGVQHAESALTFAYHYMEEFDLTFDEFNHVLELLLTLRKPEEIIVNPDVIYYFLRCRRIMKRKNFETAEDLYNKILANIRNEKPLYEVTEEG